MKYSLIILLIYLLSLETFGDDTVEIDQLAKDENQGLLLIGGIAEMEMNGKAVNTVNNTELLLPTGRTCELENVNVRFETGAGFALFDAERSQVAVCLGFLGSDPTNECEIWNKNKNIAVTAKITGDGKSYLDKIWKKDREAFLYPVYSHCQDNQNCVLFSLNYRSPDSQYSPIIAEITGMNTINFRIAMDQRLTTPFPFSSCFVFLPPPGNRLLQLGGADRKIDVHNFAAPISFAQSIGWDPKEVRLKEANSFRYVGWKKPRCNQYLQINSVHSRCMAFKVPSQNQRYRIGLFGGEDGHPDHHEKVLHTLTYHAEQNVLWYDHGNYTKTPLVCKNVPAEVFKPEISKDGGTDVQMSKHLVGLKEFSQGVLTNKEGKQVAIVAVGGSKGHHRKAKFNRKIIMLEDTAEPGKPLVSRPFPYKRRSMTSVVIPVSFLSGFNCTYRKMSDVSSAVTTELPPILLVLILLFKMS